MPDIQRKTNKCLNCKLTISESYKYCPYCGQENDHKNISFGKLIKEFFNNYLSFDSKLGRSIKPFFFSPGYLTTRFNEGERQNFANPIRLYLIISLFHFFMLSQMMQVQVPSGKGDAVRISSDEVAEQYRESKYDELILPDSILNTKPPWPFSWEQYVTFQNMRYKYEFKNEEVIDSLHLENTEAWFDRQMMKQLVRTSRSEEKALFASMIENMPLLMFLLLPIYAFGLKLLYWRRKILYIKHLIHAIHLHCFSFFMLGLSALVAIFLSTNTILIPYLVSILLITVYVYISIKKVYGQSYWKTTLKFILSGVFYFFLITYGMAAEILLSMLFY